VGLVARKIEEAGIPTVTLEMIWIYTRLVGIPRVGAIEYPFGRPYGEVGDRDGQRAVLQAAFEIFDKAREPGHVEHLPFRWHEDPKQTRWHPSEPSPIIAMINEKRGR
jgi:D-proline reductase (dithiol) PrdB